MVSNSNSTKNFQALKKQQKALWPLNSKLLYNAVALQGQADFKFFSRSSRLDSLPRGHPEKRHYIHFSSRWKVRHLPIDLMVLPVYQ